MDTDSALVEPDRPNLEYKLSILRLPANSRLRAATIQKPCLQGRSIRSIEDLLKSMRAVRPAPGRSEGRSSLPSWLFHSFDPAVVNRWLREMPPVPHHAEGRRRLLVGPPSGASTRQATHLERPHESPGREQGVMSRMPDLAGMDQDGNRVVAPHGWWNERHPQPVSGR